MCDPLDDVALATIAMLGGFTGDDVATAVAVAIAESGGRPCAHNSKPPDDSYGLWQINYYGNLRAGRIAAFGPPEGMYDPVKNAQTAASLRQSSLGWNHWSTYKSQAYRLYLARGVAAQEAVADANGPHQRGYDLPTIGIGGHDLVDLPELPHGFLPSIPNPLDGIEAVGDAFNAIRSPQLWFRIGQIAAGIGCAVVALVLINRDTLGGVAQAAAPVV